MAATPTQFNNATSTVSTPADPPIGAILVTPNDSTDLTKVCRALSIGTAGTLKVSLVGESGTVVTVVIPSNCLATGIQHSMQVTRIWSTGTTASEIVAWY